jgi:hypothetical protein
MITDTVLRGRLDSPPDGVAQEEAFLACRDLDLLARWWLRPDVLRRAHEYDPSFPYLTSSKRPKLAKEPGSCWVVFVNRGLGLLRPAFLLPLRWRRGQSHSPALPARLRTLADLVIQQLGGGWGLWLADDLEEAECRLGNDLPFEFGSGWAALAGGLLLAREGLATDPDIWASGAWGENGLAGVTGLPAKLSLAVRWGAREFYLPAWLHPAARRWLDRRGMTGLRLGNLYAVSASRPREALGDYLSRLGVRPERPTLPPDGPDENLLQHSVRYHQSLPRGEEAQAFYPPAPFAGPPLSQSLAPGVPADPPGHGGQRQPGADSAGESVPGHRFRPGPAHGGLHQAGSGGELGSGGLQPGPPAPHGRQRHAGAGPVR